MYDGFQTTNNAVGNNLMNEKWASDLMRLNKSFIIDRSDKSKKDIYKSLNCGPGSLDKKSDIKKNLQIVRNKISNKAKNIFLVHQFHSNKFIN